MNATAPGTLYVVATPIGNLDDISARAIRTLREADLVLAEDTRVSAPLLRHFRITTPLAPLHAYNERERNGRYLDMLRAGKSLALVSDAGTPLISDPGYTLVRSAREDGMAVVPIPGASAVTAALCACGLPTDRYTFEGFLPSRPAARRRALEALRGEQRTMVFFEAPHRIEETLADLVAAFGEHRRACLGRELSKLFETIVTRPLGELAQFVATDSDQRRGEIVLCVQGAEPADGSVAEGLRIAGILARYLPPGQAASVAGEITGAPRRHLYASLIGDPHKDASET